MPSGSTTPRAFLIINSIGDLYSNNRLCLICTCKVVYNKIDNTVDLICNYSKTGLSPDNRKRHFALRMAIFQIIAIATSHDDTSAYNKVLQ